MDINSNIALQGYAATKNATEPHPTAGADQGGNEFASMLQNFTQTLHEADTAAHATMIGTADSQALVQALAQTELAVEAAATIRDKVVEAYQEILRMPV